MSLVLPSQRIAQKTPRFLDFWVIGDSQVQEGPVYAVRPSEMHHMRTAARLRELGLPIRGHSMGVGGDTTAGMLLRIDDLMLPNYPAPTIASIYGGVNDPGYQTLPSITPSASGGSITASGGALYYALAFVSTNTASGFNLTMPVQTVQLAAGSANSIALGAFSLNATTTGLGVYISPIGYATAAAAAAADTRLFRFVTTLTGTTYTITAMPSGGPYCPSTSTQANIQAMVKALKYGVVGYGSQSRLGGIVYLSQANLPANAPPGMRSIVMDDTSATGGMAALASAPLQKARIAGDYSVLGAARQTVWERRTPQGGEAGWGRVAITGTAPFSGCCSRILIDSTNYLNYANGSGDNINVDTGKAYNSGASTDSASVGVYFASYQPVRVQQQAAAAAENVNDTACLYVDYFGYQSRLISSGETTQNSNLWHAIANNQHHSPYGHDILARARTETIVASRPAWISDLAA